MAGKKSSGPKLPRIPPEFDGVQVNHCKNPKCANFGIPARASVPRGRAASGGSGDGYIKVASGKDLPTLKCKICNEHPPIKSNQAIVEERDRFMAYLVRQVVSCPKDGCPNHTVPVDAPGAYQRFGKTKAGSIRLRCKVCSHVFSLPAKASLRQRQSHKNTMILKLLLSKVPMRRILDIEEISPKTLYQRIGFFHQQVTAFVANRERRLLDGMKIERLFLEVDRQDHLINWTTQGDRRNVALHAIGSADNRSGYIFGMHLDYDSDADRDAVEEDAAAIGDPTMPVAFRRYARYWLQSDYISEIRAKRLAARRKKPAAYHVGVVSDIEATYDSLSGRVDVESVPTQNVNTRLPLKGMQIRAEYAMYGHFFFLERLLRGAGKIRFALDQDSGIRAACLAAFHERIRDRTCDAFYVRINKSLNTNEARRETARSRAEFQDAVSKHPGLTERQVQLEMIKDRLGSMAAIGKWSDRWVLHPFPDMSEPEKAMCYLTDMGDYPLDQIASLYRRCSLHAIDRFFMQVRRRISLLERPIKSASTEGRTWYGYSPYSPEVVMRLLEIFRVVYNYCLTGKDGKTPAMRLGLAKGPVSYEDLVYFSDTPLQLNAA